MHVPWCVVLWHDAGAEGGLCRASDMEGGGMKTLAPAPWRPEPGDALTRLLRRGGVRGGESSSIAIGENWGESGGTCMQGISSHERKHLYVYIRVHLCIH